jgi:hypothetical protein
LATALLCLFDDLKAIVIDQGAYDADLFKNFGMRAEPIWNINSHDRALVRMVQRILAREHRELKESLVGLLEIVSQIFADKLLGANTAGKMAYVRDVTGQALSRLAPSQVGNRLVDLQNTTIELLNRQCRRLNPGTRKHAAIRKMLERIQTVVSPFDALYYRFRAMAENHLPDTLLGLDHFCEIYRDEIIAEMSHYLSAFAIEDQRVLTGWRWCRGSGIEVGYARRDCRFLTLGDTYGDCTAFRPRKQVDRETANIHWTVYSWLLDPFYQVLELYCDGQSALKAHLVPLIIRDRRVLMLDAIEVVPKLRDYVRGKPNLFLATTLFSRRREMLEAVSGTVTDLAAKMGVDAVYVDKFSNAAWVRAALDELPRDCYHIRDVEKPFGLEPIRRLIRSFTGDDEDVVVEEIQAVNVSLMDLGLRSGFKEVAVLVGTPSSQDAQLRGP